MYLSDSGQTSMLDRQHVPSVNEVLRDGRLSRDKQRASRVCPHCHLTTADSSQQMFKFADADSRALTTETKLADEALQKSLRASVPGLIHLQAADGPNQSSILQGKLAGAEDRYSATAQHRALIPPNPFNVSTLFQPTLAFIERATSIVPPGFEDETSAFGSVLEDFVVKVFLPQLDDKVTASFQQAVSGEYAWTTIYGADIQGYDAYQLDRTMPGTDKPPIKVSVPKRCKIIDTTLSLRYE